MAAVAAVGMDLGARPHKMSLAPTEKQTGQGSKLCEIFKF